MKITSGKYKYRKIDVPHGIRPTTEKVREAVFSMASQWIQGSRVLDMFAGSGAMGLEALSRGAAHCTFIESSRQNQKILLSNIANCKAGSESTVIGKDYSAALVTLEGSGPFDLIIMDPPYDRTEYYPNAMELLQQYGLVDEGSMVICEHLYDNQLLESYGMLQRAKEKKYGTIGIDVYIAQND